MSNYRRWVVPGGTYFFTLVAYRRRPILTTELGRDSLRQAIDSIRARWPFENVAMVLLPEHLHAVWSLPPNDDNYSLRLRKIKERFTRLWLANGGAEAALSASRQHKGERGIWQRRFWEHSCRDEEDVKRCVDYIH
ncbi:MAG: transposase [Pirellulales bacterium]